MSGQKVKFAHDLNIESFKYLLDSFNLEIGVGNIISASTLYKISVSEDLNPLGRDYGCYLIFSNLPKTLVPPIGGNRRHVNSSKGDDRFGCFDKIILKDGLEFRCLYNGKGISSERLKQHLFSQKSLEFCLEGNFSKFPKMKPSALHLEVMTKNQRDALIAKFPKIAETELAKLTKVSAAMKAIRADWNPEGDAELFMNGINIQDKKWREFQWAVCVVKTDPDLGGPFIETAFALKNGRPPLYSRQG